MQLQFAKQRTRTKQDKIPRCTTWGVVLQVQIFPTKTTYPFAHSTKLHFPHNAKPIRFTRKAHQLTESTRSEHVQQQQQHHACSHRFLAPSHPLRPPPPRVRQVVLSSGTGSPPAPSAANSGDRGANPVPPPPLPQHRRLTHFDQRTRLINSFGDSHVCV